MFENEAKKYASDLELIYKKGVLDGYNKANEWHYIKDGDLPEVGKLVRVRLMSGMERICETEYYEPSEDEVGFGKLILSFYELNDEWVDDNDIVAWCELPRCEEKNE